MIAYEFRNIAEMKGHDGKKYFWWCFVFTAVGYLMVVALPDRKPAQQPQPVADSASKAPVRTSAPVLSPAPAPSKAASDRVSASAVAPLIEEDQIVCPKCNTKQRSNRSCCWNCGATFVKE